MQAIHAAANGDALIAPNITRRLLATFADQAPAVPVQPIDPLTEREEEVLTLVARGRTNAEIATELFIGLSTVKTHVASLMTKLGARNRVEIAMWAYDTRRVRADWGASEVDWAYGYSQDPVCPCSLGFRSVIDGREATAMCWSCTATHRDAARSGTKRRTSAGAAQSRIATTGVAGRVACPNNYPPSPSHTAAGQGREHLVGQ